MRQSRETNPRYSNSVGTGTASALPLQWTARLLLVFEIPSLAFVSFSLTPFPSFDVTFCLLQLVWTVLVSLIRLDTSLDCNMM